MSILDRFRRADLAEAEITVPVDVHLGALRQLTETDQLATALANNGELLTERLAELELALEDVGWLRMVSEGQREFSRDGLDGIIHLSRIMFLKNPLTGRAVRVKRFYVWGQGVNVRARDETVNDLVQKFLDDPGNKRAMFGHQARGEAEETLATDGTLCMILFPSWLTGMVSVRQIAVDEIRDIITNPDDRDEVWFYRRRWVETKLNYGTGAYDQTVTREAFYPSITYRPRFRPDTIGNFEVRWDTPMHHAKVGGLGSMRFGVPETYAGQDWARAYKTFLEQVASTASSLSRFAFELTAKRGGAKGAAQRLNTMLDPTVGGIDHNPSPTAGSTFVSDGSDGTARKLNPITGKQGAMISGSEGKELRLMVASSHDIPDTILSGDPDQGNLATATTLDRPTELAMMDRQALWADIYRDLIGFYIEWQVRAPAGGLAGSGAQIKRMTPTREVVVFPDEGDRTVDVDFPPILDDNTLTSIQAITTAAGEGLIDDETVLRLLLNALEVEDVDELVERLDETRAKRMEAATAMAALAKPTDPNTDPAAGDKPADKPVPPE